MRTYCIAQGTLLRALWSPQWEGNLKKKGYLCMCVEKEIATHSSILHENPMGGGAWRAIVPGVSRSATNEVTEHIDIADSLCYAGETNTTL